MFLVAPISTRNQIGHLLNDMGLTGTGVEIGTHRGGFSRVLLRAWEGRTLFCVDPWAVPSGYEDQAETLKVAMAGGETREDDYQEALRLQDEFPGRAILLRKTSREAAESCSLSMLDLVYLDGDHREEQVRLDIALWWPRVRSGGILAGHDIICPGQVAGNWGREIQPPVWEHAKAEMVDVHLVVEEGGLPWSFLIVKP